MDRCFGYSKGVSKFSPGTAEGYRGISGTDFDNSEVARPVLGGSRDLVTTYIWAYNPSYNWGLGPQFGSLPVSSLFGRGLKH